VSRARHASEFRFWGGDVAVGCCLLALLGMMALAAHLPLGDAKAPIIAGLAGLEALLVGVFSMKLHRAPALVVLAALAGLFFIATLFAMTLTDYPFRQAGERLPSFPSAESVGAPPTVGSNLPDS
jgi:cytochrome c oxidase subunit IV